MCGQHVHSCCLSRIVDRGEVIVSGVVSSSLQPASMRGGFGDANCARKAKKEQLQHGLESATKQDVDCRPDQA